MADVTTLEINMQHLAKETAEAYSALCEFRRSTADHDNHNVVSDLVDNLHTLFISLEISHRQLMHEIIDLKTEQSRKKFWQFWK